MGLALTALLGLVACGASQGGDRQPGVRPDPLDDITAEELYRRGIVVAQSGDYTRAEQYLAASMSRGHPPERVLPALLEVCIESSRMVAALEYAEPYLEQHPSQWSLRLLIASIHMGLGHNDHARSELERVVRDAPDDAAQAHYFLGVLYRDELDDRELSATHFAHYLALAPEGTHQEEARASLPTSEAVPQRIDAEDVPDPAPRDAAGGPDADAVAEGEGSSDPTTDTAEPASTED